MKTVAIIGGGFSGTLTAINLSRLSHQPLRVVLINTTHPLGRGVAYGTKRSEHLLNVAARNMSAVPDHPDHFMEWLRTRTDYVDLPEAELRESFIPRCIYGDYIRSILLGYLDPIDEHHLVEIEMIEDEAIDVVVENEDSVEVLLSNGDSIQANRVLLATGNQPPAPMPSKEPDFEHAAYCDNPWSNWAAKIPENDQPIVVLGTGLTMVDVFLTLMEKEWTGKIIAISRNGMIPQSHFCGIEYPDFLPEHPENIGLENLVKLLEDHCQQLSEQGENPGIIVDRLRPYTQQIWQGFSLAEKQQFMKKYAARWNVIRHRIAQSIHKKLTGKISNGQVSIVKGTITDVSAANENVNVTICKLNGETETISGGLVINCTGPKSGYSETTLPLFANLLQRGLIRSDELDMGIEVGPDFAVVDADGQSSSFLYSMGPLMKGMLWETIAVPELRGQSMRVAQVLLDEVAPEQIGKDFRFSVEEEHVIEYYI
ncbi:hypothetical protein MNBD_PLANCTO02-1905 [hydrothermal vent metagenome]|uniref:FAD-dependent urate hydroxylase HpyO/Asp monooxygenase CreE-like FAD/NAD(P)-binding domain-containing protein n=1 Tax=hydrothermal vent metagenome TaxID=652676 RepID=A0A3B1DZT3_9ZZZZ